MIRALLGARNESVRDLARALHIADTQVHKRLKGVIPWRAYELEAIAEHFDVAVGVLYRDPMESLKTRSEKSRTAGQRHLTSLDGGGQPPRKNLGSPLLAGV